MRIVIVGATGNLGTALLRRLHNEPTVSGIVGVSRRLPDRSTAPYNGVAWHALDIGSPSAPRHLARIFSGADAVVHLGWALQPNHDEAALWRTNVIGTKNILAAVAAARVPQFSYASSVASYSPGPKTMRVDERWPTGGIPSSHYSRHKAINERALDRFEENYPSIVVSRLRPGFVFQREAGSEIAGLFAGQLVPLGWLRFVRPPFVPMPRQFVAQVVHADDVADAFWRALDRGAAGAFNIAAEPIIDPTVAASVLESRWLPVRLSILRALVQVTWKLRLQVADPGWVDAGAMVPVMSTARARDELGWSPKVASTVALGEIVRGMAEHANVEASPQLRG
ncbi:NAD-dependent epimerase/dehydratase family protein [Mycetocola sp.]|uniref:NAD-dependent epimerase/dehydratase family protein n=1 Tax=Mycetocola sp. TaxID=1871042 RepID=UPI00260BFCBA|nr:NAD-dependent epimerase/dehydratase family protein [Mycetocola sp.]MCU1560496.1 epimerase [Mycetocola sp.]